MGWNHEVVKINGGTVYTAPDGTLTGYSGGLLALDTNIGDYSQDVFLVIPEFGVQMSYQFTCHLRGFVGYDFLYWGQVARAGDQISLRVDPANIPPKIQGGGPDPAFNFNQASFWAQGVRFGRGVAVLAGLSPAPRRQPPAIPPASSKASVPGSGTVGWVVAGAQYVGPIGSPELPAAEARNRRFETWSG